MPETIAPPEAPKPSFTQRLAASRPKTEAEFKAAEAAPDAPPTPPAAAPATPPQPEPSKITPAAPAPAAPPPATPDLDDEIITGKRSPKADDFRRVKQGRDEAKKMAEEFKGKAEKAEAYEKELTELRKRPVHNADIIKKIETERDEYKSKYDAFIVQFSPEFQAKFDGEVSAVVGNLKASIGDKADSLVDILRLPDSEAKKRQIAELTEDMDALQIAEVAQANRDLRAIQATHRASLEKANKTLASIHEGRRKEAEDRQAAQAKSFEEIEAAVASGDRAIPVFQKRDGDSAWNKDVAERVAVARAVYEGKFDNDSERAEAAFWSAAAPSILASAKADIAAKEARIAELEGTIAKLQGANPGLVGGQPTTTGKKMSFTERMASSREM